MSSRLAKAEPPTQSAKPISASQRLPCLVLPLAPEWHAVWEVYVTGHADGTIFHTLGWRDAVKDAFAHEDVYLLALRDNRVVGVLPLFMVASRIAGRMLVSVPYGVGGGIIADDEDAANTLFAAAKQVMTERRCVTMDLRSEKPAIASLATVDRYVGFMREMPSESRDVPAWLPRKARAAARNARDKYRVTVSFGDQQLRDVWQLYAVSMRRLGSLCYPYVFFERLMDCTPKGHWVSVARWQGRAVGGLVTFLFKDRVIPYFIGTTPDARRCCAANLLYLSVMERGVESGYRVFDFGRSRKDNTGSYNFKRFHGFAPRPLGYQQYSAPGKRPPNLSPTNPRFRLARRIWPHLPLAVTKLLGASLAKHIPG